MAIISLQIPGGFTKQLRDGVRTEVFRQINNRLAIQAINIQKLISNYIIAIFESTDIITSLRGKGPVDLQAHFGLSNTLANTLVDGMGGIIHNSIKIGTIKRGFAGSIIIKAVESDWIKYTQIPGAEYLSKPSNVQIPVIEWMLINPNIDIGQAAYEIVFKGDENGKFDSRIEKVSRSGRAIMVSLSSLGGVGGYVLPDIISKNAGMNFIELAIGNPVVIENVVQLLMSRII